MKRFVLSVALTLLIPGAYGAGSGAMSGGDMSGGASATRRSPQQMEAASYKAGLNHKKRAAQYEAKSTNAKNDAERDKLLAKAKGQYEDAIADYIKAVGYNQRSYQTFNELGYAYRKIGDYNTAVRAYDAALTVKSDFAPAIEYRGEAYLALGRFDAVKQAYLTLFGSDQDLAAMLMQAMDAWVTQHGADATADAKAFSEWVVERRTVASQTQTLSMNNARVWD